MSSTNTQEPSGLHCGGVAGAVPISKDIWLYQLTDNGLAVELTAKGTKYYKDKDLN
jgi:hypothetical protein